MSDKRIGAWVVSGLGFSVFLLFALLMCFNHKENMEKEHTKQLQIQSQVQTNAVINIEK